MRHTWVMFDSSAQHLDDLAEFVRASPTSYHAASCLADRLRSFGFVEQPETESFQTGAGRYFVKRHGAVVAWVQPETVESVAGFRVVGTHTDSPGFKVKPQGQFSSSGWNQVAVEIYGGPLLNSWLDRELGIAGRIVTKHGQIRLVRSGPIARIPQLAIHLMREANDGLKLDRQTHTQPVLSIESKESLLKVLCALADVSIDDLAMHDLFTYVCEPPSRFGLADEFFASARLDNLSSTHAGLVALSGLAPADGGIPMLAAFDHEEVGSATSSGAQGPLLEAVLERIADQAGLSRDQYRAMLAASSCVSADAGHLVHPNYPGHHDPLVQPLPNRGPLVKINANQRYTTDAVSGAMWLQACATAGVPTQAFVSNNSMPCGSTIGPITAARLGIDTVDVGIGLLSMHSAREMCEVEDPHFLARGMFAYLQGA